MDPLSYLVAVFYVTLFALHDTDGACTMPDVFRGSTWVDSVKGNVTFSTWKMTGWSFQSTSYTVSTWELVDDTQFDQGGYVAFRSWETFQAENKTWYSYLCLNFTKVTDNSYIYYQLHNQEPLAGQERIKIYPQDSLSSFSDICDETYQVPKSEFHFMVKAGTEESSKITCPNPVLAKFDYTYNTVNDQTECGPSQDNWDVCTDKTTMTFNYTSCPQKMMYSNEGKVICMAATTEGDSTFVLVYNLDANNKIDNNNTYQFTCMATTTDGQLVSVVPRNCTPDQNPYEFPLDHTGNKFGAKITNRALMRCPITAAEPPASDELNIPVIVGASIGGAVALVLIIVVVVFVVKRCRRKKTRWDK